MHQKIDSIPDRSGEWMTKDLHFDDLPDQNFTIRYRDPVKAIQSLWADSLNAEHFVYAPKKVYSDNSKIPEYSLKCGPVNGGTLYRFVL